MGDAQNVGTATRAMKGYIALSGMSTAHDIKLAQAFSPYLFMSGQQHWPTLLLEVQEGSISYVDETFVQLCQEEDLVRHR